MTNTGSGPLDRFATQPSRLPGNFDASNARNPWIGEGIKFPVQEPVDLTKPFNGVKDATDLIDSIEPNDPYKSRNTVESLGQTRPHLTEADRAAQAAEQLAFETAQAAFTTAMGDALAAALYGAAAGGAIGGVIGNLGGGGTDTVDSPRPGDPAIPDGQQPAIPTDPVGRPVYTQPVAETPQAPPNTPALPPVQAPPPDPTFPPLPKPVTDLLGEYGGAQFQYLAGRKRRIKW